MLAPRRAARERCAEHEARCHQPVERHRSAFDVFQNRSLAAVQPAGGDQAVEQGFVLRAGLKDHVAHDVVEHLADQLPAPASLDLLGQLEALRVENGQRDLGEQALAEDVAEPREVGVLGAVDADRQDRRVGQIGDGTGALVDLHQAARHGQPALRKDHAFAPLAHPVHQFAYRQRAGRIERQEIEHREGGLHPPLLRDMGVDTEHGRVGKERAEDGRVEEGCVVGHDHDAISGPSGSSPSP